MSTTHESTKVCPKCQVPLPAELTSSGRPFTCFHCGAQLLKKSRGSEAHVDATYDTGSVESDGVLAFLEDLLVRMIVGVFRFIFVKLPSELYRALRRWFPTLMRVVKILILLVAWLTLVFGPLFGSLHRAGSAKMWLPYEITVPAFYLRHAQLLDALVLGYSAIAVVGSIWGAVYMRRRRKGLLSTQAPAQ